MPATLLAYHADDEIARAESIARAVLFLAVALLAVIVAARRTHAPAGGRNRNARLALGVAAVGIAAWLLWGLVPDDGVGRVGEASWFAFALATLLAALVAPGLALAGLLRRSGGEPRLAAAALGFSLLLPAAGAGSALACLVTGECFH